MPNDVFRDLRRTKHFHVDHKIIDDYLPAIGGNAFMLYSIYCRLASVFDDVFPSLRTIQKNTGFSRSSIAKYNDILEEVGLIKIERTCYSNQRKETDDADSKFPRNESNVYFLLEPEGLSEELKRKYYPANWTPIIKSKRPGLKNGPGVSDASPGLIFGPGPGLKNGQAPSPKNGPGLVQNLDPIDIKSFVVDLNVSKTTTYCESLLTSMSNHLNVEINDAAGMKSILKTAQKKTSDAALAHHYVLSKIMEIPVRVANPMGWLHRAVEEDWQDYLSKSKKQAEKDSAVRKELDIKNQELHEARTREAWKKLSDETKAKRWMPAAVNRFFMKHKRKPNDREERDIFDQMIKNHKYDCISIDGPDSNFNYQGEL